MSATGDDRLTAANAKAMKPGEVLYDDVVRGLELHRRANRHSFSLYYRTRSGVQRRPTIGRWPDISIEQARRVARGILERVAMGEDPSAVWKEDRAAPTVADLWELYKAWLMKHREASTVAEYERQAKSVILPHAIARKRVKDVVLTDVEDWLADVRARRLTGEVHSPSKKEAPKAGNRALAILSGMFKHAELRTGEPPWRARNTNPCAGAEKAPPGRRYRYATADELGRIGEVIRAKQPAQPREAALLRLHLYTGARTSELVGIRWTDLPADYSVVTLGRHKTSRRTGVKVLKFAPPARAEFEFVAKFQIKDKDGLVFAGLAKDKPLRAFWENVREEAGCPDLQIRDLRRTFASLAYDPGAKETTNSRILQDLLGHTRAETTAIYTVLFSEAREKAAAATADRAADLLGMHSPKAHDDSRKNNGPETERD